MVKLLFFGPLSDVLELESMSLALTDDIKTIQDIVAVLHLRGARWQRYLNTDKLQITCNRQFCNANSEIKDSDEIAFISRAGSI